MAKKQEQYVSKQEFLDLKASIAKQQEGITDILQLLQTSKGLVALVKTFGAIGASLTAILYFFQNLKG